MPYTNHMHAAIETSAYRSACKDAGMSEEEMQAVVDIVAADPMVGGRHAPLRRRP
jgi:phage-related minor tail protein